MTKLISIFVHVLGYATLCPRDASPFELPEWNACMVWVLNGSNRVVLQNFVYSHNDCTEEKLDHWAEYISKVWREPGTAKCCFQVSIIVIAFFVLPTVWADTIKPNRTFELLMESFGIHGIEC